MLYPGVWKQKKLWTNMAAAAKRKMIMPNHFRNNIHIYVYEGPTSVDASKPRYGPPETNGSVEKKSR
jgi:hypothetical protein